MRRFGFILSIVVVMTVASCDHHPIECADNGTGVVKIAFDWHNAPGANPAGMTVIFYPVSEGTRQWEFNLDGCDGGVVEIPWGIYNVAAYNNDTRHLEIPDVAYADDLSAYMTAYSGNQSEPVGGQPLVSFPTAIYSGRAGMVKVTSCGVEYTPYDDSLDRTCKTCPYSVLRLYPDSAFCRYTVRINHLKNFTSSSRLTGTLDGLSRGVNLWDNSRVGSTCAGSFPITVTADSTAVSTFLTLGVAEASATVCNLNLLLQVNSDKAAVYSYDVTRQIVEAPDRRNVTIVVDSLTAPVDSTEMPPGAFEVGVQDWSTIIIDLTTDINI